LRPVGIVHPVSSRLLLETPGEEFSRELTYQRSLEGFALISLKNVNMEARYDVRSQFERFSTRMNENVTQIIIVVEHAD